MHLVSRSPQLGEKRFTRLGRLLGREIYTRPQEAPNFSFKNVTSKIRYTF